MELKVRKIGNGYGVLLPKQLLDELALEEGSLLGVEKVDGAYRMVPVDAEFYAAGGGVSADRAAA
jgi:antitoxin component of MazEF toxin-antitoxin module